MAFETKEEILEKILLEKKPVCPHCGVEMNLWEAPSIPFGDGLGWGVPYLFLCFNDECPIYKEGWDNIQENFGHNASYRSFCYPGTDNFECMPVFSKMGGTGQIIDDETVLQQEILKENIKKGFSILTDCYLSKDYVTVLNLLLDITEPARVRLKAAEMIGDIGELEVIEPIRNLKFPNTPIQKKVDESIAKIHKKFFTRECPFCAEIIKKRAAICKHCQRDVAGK